MPNIDLCFVLKMSRLLHFSSFQIKKIFQVIHGECDLDVLFLLNFYFILVVQNVHFLLT